MRIYKGQTVLIDHEASPETTAANGKIRFQLVLKCQPSVEISVPLNVSRQEPAVVKYRLLEKRFAGFAIIQPPPRVDVYNCAGELVDNLFRVDAPRCSGSSFPR